MNKRHVDVVVMSDFHLGTYGCHAQEILTYLKSISPRLLILNGDIIDGWQFSKHYFPAVHMAGDQRDHELLAKVQALSILPAIMMRCCAVILMLSLVISSSPIN